jgi:hypothetical protein
LQIKRNSDKDAAFTLRADQMKTWLTGERMRSTRHGAVASRYAAAIASASMIAARLLGDWVRDSRHETPESTGSLAWLQHASPASKNSETQSLGNESEADFVGYLAAVLIDAADAESRASPAGIIGGSGNDDCCDEMSGRCVVITPYLHHKALIEGAIARGLAELQDIELGEALHHVTSSGIVNTADSFQGQVRERDSKH